MLLQKTLLMCSESPGHDRKLDTIWHDHLVNYYLSELMPHMENQIYGRVGMWKDQNCHKKVRWESHKKIRFMPNFLVEWMWICTVLLMMEIIIKCSNILNIFILRCLLKILWYLILSVLIPGLSKQLIKKHNILESNQIKITIKGIILWSVSIIA